MVLDASTLLSRTTAGDAELHKATNGLSLGQRKLLSFLDQPQALEELSDEHSLEREKLARDLAKLASLNLVAIDGQVREAAPTGVVLGGVRAPTLMRWLLPLLFVVSAAALYFVMRAPASHRPADGSSIIASESRAAPETAAPIAAASVTSAPDAAPVPAPVAAVPAAPLPSRDKIAAATPPMAGADGRNAVGATPRAAPDASKAVALPARLQVEEAPADATRATPADPVTTAVASAKVTTAAQPSPTRPDAAAAVAPATAAASTPAVSAPLAAPAPTAAPVAPAATGPTVAATTSPAPVKLAMAAPGSNPAHPVAEVRLLPLTRQDPEFPREAIVRGVSTGVVKARLAIDAGGHVSAVNIVDARPSRVFDRAVSDALSHWTFPAGDAGRSTEVEIAFHRD